MLIEQPLRLSDDPLPEIARALIDKGREFFSSVDCFDFVPSDYELVWRVLGSVAGARFCEWGSGLGVVTGLAEIRGFAAHGIEINASLVVASRRLLASAGLAASIEQGDYLAIEHRADVYFVYCWPGRMAATEAHFAATAPREARLLICHGQSDIRCKVRG